MKRTIEKEVTICDNCKAESYVSRCLSCGTEHCWRCRESCGREYHQALYISGSGDGYYCKACDAKLTQSGDKLHAAFQKIETLQRESTAWNENFEQRRQNAEQELEAIPRPA